tara:strand:- start:626 stop:871 length:246 start_codon:yes stop_codon:yes gene_type:complete
MYLIIKIDDFGSAGKNYSVAGHDEDRSNAIRKLLALDTLNDNKKKVSYALWSSAHGDLNTSTERAFGTPNDSYEEEAGANE